MMDHDRFERQKEFILEIDKEKTITRQTHLTGHGRQENDAEHAWHMAVMAYLLKEYANDEIDIAKTMLMCLIHDIVEIDAGDTYAYDEEAKKSQKEREEKAKDRIFSLLPKDQKDYLMAVFEEFEEYKTAESRFAHTMDNLQPFMLNDSNGGSDWVEHGICASQIWGRQGQTGRGSKVLGDYVKERIAANIEKGSIIDDGAVFDEDKKDIDT